MQVRFMVLEAMEVDDASQDALTVKAVTEYLNIAEVREIKFHNECVDSKNNQVIVELVIDEKTRYWLPVLPDTMAYFIDLSNGINLDWSGYYGVQIERVCGRVNRAELKEAVARNLETWKIHEEAVNDGYTE